MMRRLLLRFGVLTLILIAGFVVILPAHAQTDIIVTPLTSVTHEACGTVASNSLVPNVECVVAMRNQPEPVVSQVTRDGATLSNYSFWQVAPGVTSLFDSPGGNPIGQMADGFNFVNAVDTSVPDWVQIEGGQWVRQADVSPTPASEFRGVQVLDGLERPFAWALGNLFTSPEPGAPQSRDTGRLLLRYDRVNIFASVQHEGFNWYMVGPDQWVEQRSLGLVQRVERPAGVSGRWVAVDLYEQTLVAYEEDTPVFATLSSSGLAGFDTNVGVFEVWARLSRDGMSGATGAPDAYALQSVPWVMYFDGDISLHGTYWHDGFGYRRSHGCVNLSISDARHLFTWTADQEPDANGDVRTFVYVYNTGEYGSNGR